MPKSSVTHVYITGEALYLMHHLTVKLLNENCCAFQRCFCATILSINKIKIQPNVDQRWHTNITSPMKF